MQILRILALLALPAGFLGCERAPAPRMTASQPTPPPASASAPATPAERPAEPATAPASAPTDELPDYVSVDEKRDSKRIARVKAETRGDNTLILTTENVLRMVLRNENLPTRAMGSVFLRIDGKVIEWTRKQASLELEHTPNGDWIVPAPVSNKP